MLSLAPATRLRVSYPGQTIRLGRKSRCTVRVACGLNPYRTLGVQEGATEKEVKRAYRKLALRHHPDISDDELAHEKFMAIQKAYEILTGKARGKEIDCEHSSSGWDFHDWYWSFAAKRRWRKQQAAQHAQAQPHIDEHHREQVRSQLHGLRQRAAARAAKRRTQEPVAHDLRSAVQNTAPLNEAAQHRSMPATASHTYARTASSSQHAAAETRSDHAWEHAAMPASTDHIAFAAAAAERINAAAESTQSEPALASVVRGHAAEHHGHSYNISAHASQLHTANARNSTHSMDFASVPSSSQQSHAAVDDHRVTAARAQRAQRKDGSAAGFAQRLKTTLYAWHTAHVCVVHEIHHAHSEFFQKHAYGRLGTSMQHFSRVWLQHTLLGEDRDMSAVSSRIRNSGWYQLIENVAATRPWLHELDSVLRWTRDPFAELLRDAADTGPQTSHTGPQPFHTSRAMLESIWAKLPAHAEHTVASGPQHGPVHMDEWHAATNKHSIPIAVPLQATSSFAWDKAQLDAGSLNHGVHAAANAGSEEGRHVNGWHVVGGIEGHAVHAAAHSSTADTGDSDAEEDATCRSRQPRFVAEHHRERLQGQLAGLQRRAALRRANAV